MNDPDYGALIRSALIQIHQEASAGRSVTGLAEWLLQLSRDQDKLRKQQGKVVQLNGYRRTRLPIRLTQ